MKNVANFTNMGLFLKVDLSPLESLLKGVVGVVLRVVEDVEAKVVKVLDNRGLVLVKIDVSV